MLEELDYNAPFTTDQIRRDMNLYYYADEQACMEHLMNKIQRTEFEVEDTQARAKQLILEVREQRQQKSYLDAFMHQYSLSTEQGVALMCLAEAMLRIPDSATVDELIRDKISSSDWQEQMGKSSSFFVNASTWALMLTGKVVANPSKENLGSTLKSWLRSSSEPFIRAAMHQAMKVLSRQFVMGQTIEEALKRSKQKGNADYLYSYDMLGEAARTNQAAEDYFQSYQQAIDAIAKDPDYADCDLVNKPGISVKLSALHPRYEFRQSFRITDKIAAKLLTLAQQAKAANIHLTVDAEEASVLEMSLAIIERVFVDPSLEGWHGFGVAVQAYQKRAPWVIDWLAALAKRQQRQMMIRLVKGAYWDTEIKYAQVQNLPDYPVFTRKNNTDVSFLACAQQILDYGNAVFYPQFGTHNAYSVSAIIEMAQGEYDFEFQCLHGMGAALYDYVIHEMGIPCRVYAPVGGHRDLLAYLVRRLLENGANTSFVNRLADEQLPIEEMVVDPIAQALTYEGKAHPHIPLPNDIYGPERPNSKGVDVSNLNHRQPVLAAINDARLISWQAQPIVNGIYLAGNKEQVYSPQDQSHCMGEVQWALPEQIEQALQQAQQSQKNWDAMPVDKRAQCLEKIADLYEKHFKHLVALAVVEAGKTIDDGIAEVREAIDFCRYYATQAKRQLVSQDMPGPTGELNQLNYVGKGTACCISPWNFPLAIFTGQITAALVAGNAVIAKPAEQTPIIAYEAIKLMHEAGVPTDILHFLPGDGESVGSPLVNDQRVHIVLFTGSVDTAHLINKQLANRPGPITPLIAETGGQNAMIIDSTALLEQAVVDVLTSAFGSAGQRCSALRVLYIQQDIADNFIEMLRGAMQEWQVGLPGMIETDCGPVIDEVALYDLMEHREAMKDKATLLAQAPLADGSERGHFFAPCAFELQHIQDLEREVFGPCLHVIRYQADEIDEVLANINATGYGLTQGVHTRINEKAHYVYRHLNVGNTYINRNMTGAVVGVQPFGGQGLSGTGPKAGGPSYLLRLVNERTLTIDTTASGGNASLLTLEE